MNRGIKVAVSWSGGKDSALSLFRAIRSGLHIHCLLNLINHDASRSMSHGLDPRLIAAQAEALEIPIVQRKTTWETYEDEFKRAVVDMKQQGVSAVVFGDIDADIEEHRDWIERVSAELEVRPISPLGGGTPLGLLTEFIDAGFEAIVVCAKAELLGEEWLGRKMDAGFIQELQRKDFHPCGELGEYHTLVTNGPIFKRRIDITDSEKVLREGYRFLDISSFALSPR
jgi:diphthine-ammonia ligase